MHAPDAVCGPVSARPSSRLLVFPQPQPPQSLLQGSTQFEGPCCPPGSGLTPFLSCWGLHLLPSTWWAPATVGGEGGFEASRELGVRHSKVSSGTLGRQGNRLLYPRDQGCGCSQGRTGLHADQRLQGGSQSKARHGFLFTLFSVRVRGTRQKLDSALDRSLTAKPPQHV